MEHYKNIIIYPHNSFNLSDSEISIQYYLAKILNNLGINVQICNVYDSNSKNTIYNKFISIDDMNNINFEDTIIIYSECIIGNPLKAKYVVRWVLGKSEKDIPLDYYNTWANDELIYFLNNREYLNKDDYIKNLSLFYLDEHVQNLYNKKKGTCYFNKDLFYNTQIHEEPSFKIKDSLDQLSQCETFNYFEKFIAYDPCIYLNI